MIAIEQLFRICKNRKGRFKKKQKWQQNKALR